VADSIIELRSCLAAVRRRWFALAALRASARALGAAALPILGALAIELLVRPQGVALILVAGVALLASAALAGFAIARMQPRPDDRRMARFIEERATQVPQAEPLDDAVVSAVEVSEGPIAPGREPFVPLIVDAALSRLRALPPERLIEAGAIRTAALQAAGSAALLGLVLWLGAPALGRAFDTAQVRFFPGSIDVRVEPGDTGVPAGTPLRIRAVVTGRETVLSRYPPSLVVSAGGEERTVPMARTGEGFEYTFESVDRSFSYRVSAGRATSDAYDVTALFPPRVRQIDLRYDYPSFTGLAARDDEDGGDIYGPAGTSVRVRVHTDKPIAEGELALVLVAGAADRGTSTTPLALRRAGDRLLEADLVLRADGSYRIRLSDEDGLHTDDHTEYYIRLMDDRPPDVRILRPSADQSITPLEEVTIEARADDDYGIGRFELVFSVGGDQERVVPFARTTGTDVQKVGSRILAAEELGVKPGDVISYYARAWDVGRGKRPTLAQSDIFFLEVKPFSEEFVLAESQGGGGGGAAGAQIESLIAAQKEIISATWNLERRSQHGVSDDDLRRVVEAQAELRKRTEALATQGRGGRIRMEAPIERIARTLASAVAEQARQGTPDPVASAIEAMGRAVAELEGRKTGDAIQHEMAALNGLLAAQAEVRRREVRRQAAGGGGGGWGNRNAQDLSALFDRELQRQQRTTYATRNSVQNREERRTQDEGPADRIRDLARRQEDLNRRQRELAKANLAEEERKRQLERLTREQAELREQAEALQKQMQGQQAPSGERARSGGQGQPQAGGVREASEQMRNAAGELQKDNVESAAVRGEQAAEQLRRLEREMRGQSGGAGQRSAAELEVEARQIAQEQRRIASEAERLGTSQGDTSAARDRLANEKDRLAGRVDELQRAAREQAQRQGAAAQSAAEAARELEQQRIGQQMRDGARQMRQGQQGQGAGAERQLAQALDDVADRLAGRSSDEARGLSAQLDQANQIRDRLNRLEQQMREAAAREAAQGGERGKAGQDTNAKPAPQSGEKPGQGEKPGEGARGTSGGERSELERLREQYDRELQKAREALGQRQQDSSGGAGATAEQHEFATSAPGTESWKQDRSEWASLRQGIDSALARQEAAASDRLGRALAEDRLSAGGSDRVPDAYQRLIARYYESLARARR
jgi:hypothetical protein